MNHFKKLKLFIEIIYLFKYVMLILFFYSQTARKRLGRRILSKQLKFGTHPPFVFLVFWHPRQVSSRLNRVQRRLKGLLWPLLACFALPTLPGFYFIACTSINFFLPQTRCFSFVSTNWGQFKDKQRAYSDK